MHYRLNFFEGEGLIHQPSARTFYDIFTFKYVLMQLLRRAFDLMRERNPELNQESGGLGHRVVMKPPELSRIGTKKTCFVNYGEICSQCAK